MNLRKLLSDKKLIEEQEQKIILLEESIKQREFEIKDVKNNNN